MHPAVAVGLVFGGCCSNVVFLELLARCGAADRIWGGIKGQGAHSNGIGVRALPRRPQGL